MSAGCFPNAWEKCIPKHYTHTRRLASLSAGCVPNASAVLWSFQSSCCCWGIFYLMEIYFRSFSDVCTGRVCSKRKPGHVGHHQIVLHLVSCSYRAKLHNLLYEDSNCCSKHPLFTSVFIACVLNISNLFTTCSFYFSYLQFGSTPNSCRIYYLHMLTLSPLWLRLWSKRPRNAFLTTLLPSWPAVFQMHFHSL